MSFQLNSSYWEKDTFFTHYDVIIIGGGLVGLSTAMALSERDKHISIAVLERGAIPTGASTRNAGFACFGSISELKDDLSSMSEDKLKQLVSMRKSGLDNLRSLIDDSDMDYQQYGGFEFFLPGEEALYHSCTQKLDYFNELVFQATGLENTYSIVEPRDLDVTVDLPLIKNRHESQLHPAKMIKALINKASRSAHVFFGTEVSTIKEKQDHVSIQLKDSREISCDKLIHATNGFTKHLPELEDIKPVRNQVFVTSEIKDLRWRGCFHVDEGYVYFRNIGNRILIGGARNRFLNENVGSFGITREVEDYLKSFIEQHLNINEAFQFEHKWSGILAVGSQKKPIIKQHTSRQFVGVRMGGMGVAIGSLVGTELANLVLDQQQIKR